MNVRVFFLLSIFFWVACEEDRLFDNLPPDTQVFLEEINLSGLDRLNSIVRLHWSGEDQDGFVIGYEWSLDQVRWSFTSTQDSTFRFDITEGQDSADITFYIRAIDNDSLPDPSPALLTIPIINSPPSIALDSTNFIPDTVFSVFSTGWVADDLDGITTLDSIFIKINDGPWLSLSRQTNFITIVPEDPDIIGTQDGRIFSGLEAAELSFSIPGLRVGGDNQLMVKVRDITGAESEVDSTNVFYVRPQSGDLLLIDVHRDRDADAFYQTTLNDVYPNYDLRDLLADPPTFFDPTFRLFLSLYDKVVWYSEGEEQSDFGQRLLMDVAAPQIQSFLNEGGKLFASTRFPSSFLEPDAALSLIFDFSPIDSFSTQSGQGRLGRADTIRAVSTAFMELPTLITNSGAVISGVDPFFPKNAFDALYEADILAAGGNPWTGPRTIAARSTFRNGRTNQVFFSVELHKLNEDGEALREFVRFVLVEEFEW